MDRIFSLELCGLSSYSFEACSKNSESEKTIFLSISGYVSDLRSHLLHNSDLQVSSQEE